MVIFIASVGKRIKTDIPKVVHRHESTHPLPEILDKQKHIMNVLFCADPHLGHKNIHKFRDAVTSPEHNTRLFRREARAKLNKRTITFYLGDIAFDEESLDVIKELPGRKILIKGNHDDMTTTAAQLEAFEEIHGMFRYKKMWLTHAPIHPQQLFGMLNVHGHVHNKTVTRWGRPDKRYLNLCPDVQGQYFTTLEEVRKLRP